MKRSPLLRRTALVRRTPLPRGKGLRRVNAARQGAERERQFGPLAAFVRTLPCAIAGCPRRTVAAHVHGRRNAGAWRERPDGGAPVGNLVGLCRAHHDEQHRVGIVTFQVRYGINLEAVAEAIGCAFLRTPEAKDTSR